MFTSRDTKPALNLLSQIVDPVTYSHIQLHIGIWGSLLQFTAIY